MADVLAEYLRPATGFDFGVEPFNGQEAPLIHLVSCGNPPPDEDGFSSERYSCEVTPAGIVIEAETPAGLARGIQTFRQLLPEASFSSRVEQCSWSIPCLSITDEPRFRWRGLHLDVARHFFTVSEVCRFIDLLALHRYNVIHLHLTDDQGWRVEIAKYPRLTEVGAWRSQTLIGHDVTRPRRYDGRPYGGFYTRDDILAIVAFASRRKVTVVPEIEMPGHAQAAIAAYPEFGNGAGVLAPRCHWGISPHTFNVEEASIRFLCNVLSEVVEMFPSRFIHIGGDEAVKNEWAESAAAQARMAELGLHSEEELQSWFIGRIGAHIQQLGRRIVGWDEILLGGIPVGATIMSWQGENGGIKAVEAGHDVVMTPMERVYFNFYQSEPVDGQPLAIGGLLTLEQVYTYEPVPLTLDPALWHHVLGAQGELWSEYIDNRDLLDFMTYPRACALAEVLWLPREMKDYARFSRDLAAHRRRFQKLGVNAWQ